jgi:cell division protein FtsB
LPVGIVEANVKWLSPALILLILLLQYPLWFGDTGWLRLLSDNRKVEEQRQLNEKLHQRNAAFAAEVQDLKQGKDAIDERARSELGMIRPDEIYVRLVGNAVSREAQENKQ